MIPRKVFIFMSRENPEDSEVVEATSVEAALTALANVLEVPESLVEDKFSVYETYLIRA